uniref:Uncharacterized protein n=1 Tax=Arundo donax TaxID=35708 RepID=A0A0A9DM98_ARUDO
MLAAATTTAQARLTVKLPLQRFPVLASCAANLPEAARSSSARPRSSPPPLLASCRARTAAAAVHCRPAAQDLLARGARRISPGVFSSAPCFDLIAPWPDCTSPPSSPTPVAGASFPPPIVSSASSRSPPSIPRSQ